MPSVWTRSCFVSTAGNVSSEIIKRYVENQSICIEELNVTGMVNKLTESISDVPWSGFVRQLT